MKRSTLGKLTGVFMLLGLALGLNGCAATGPTVPKEAILIYHGPAQDISTTALSRPGELYLADEVGGEVIKTMHVPAENESNGEPKTDFHFECLKPGHIYSFYYLPLNKNQEK